MASGPLESVNINSRRFPVDGEAAAVINLGGYTNEVKANGQPGDSRIVKSRRPGKIGAIPIVIDNTRGDMEFIQEVIDSNDFVPFYADEIDGTTWEGNVQITATPEKNTKEGVMEIEIMGFIKRQGT
jgi:hypothetical protein